MKLRSLFVPVLGVVLLGMTVTTEAHKVIRDGRVVPHWVRYPFEFQLCGIALGTRGVDRDPANKIDRYSLFFVHGNPTAVVSAGTGVVSAAQAPPGSGAPVLETTPNAPWMSAVNISIPGGHIMWLYRRDGFAMGYVIDPLGFVTAITVAGDDCPIAATQMGDPYHKVQLGDDFRKVLWRYGYPDILTLFGESGAGAGGGAGGAGDGGGGAGALSGILQGPSYVRAPNQRQQRDVELLASRLANVTTQSSARFKPGRNSEVPPLPPASLEVRMSAFGGAMAMGGGAMGPGASGLGGGAMGPGGGAAGPGGGSSGGFGDGGAGGGAVGGGTAGIGGTAFTTYQLDYRDTYNVMFTIRNNQVVRIFIWGDPDYFTDRQRKIMRVAF